MKIQDIIQALELVENLGIDNQPEEAQDTAELPRRVIVRGDRSGVFYGTIVARNGTEVTLKDCRHIWYWSGAANTAEIANSGVSKPDDCKIVAPVSRILVLDAIEVLDCTPEAVVSLDAVQYWSKR